MCFLLRKNIPVQFSPNSLNSCHNFYILASWMDHQTDDTESCVTLPLFSVFEYTLVITYGSNIESFSMDYTSLACSTIVLAFKLLCSNQYCKTFRVDFFNNNGTSNISTKAIDSNRLYNDCGICSMSFWVAKHGISANK